MAANLVPTVKTSYNSTEMIRGFIEGWKKAFNEIPKKECIAVLWAQNQLETGGTVSMWNNNIGNVKFVASANPNDDSGKDYMMLANVWEIVNGKRLVFQPPHPATWFRSFATLGDGISWHMSFLMNKRYKIAWQAVVEGDPVKFCKLLRQQGYYTAPEADYTKAVMGYFNIFMRGKTFDSVVAEIKAAEAPPPPPVPQEPVQPIHDITIPEREIDLGNDEPVKLSPWQKVQNSLFKLFKR
jgi:flagellar protein FlgJ